MSYTYRDRGIVLRSYDYGDGHRIIAVYTLKNGKLKASAKGSRKIKSRFGSMLEPFSENEFILYRKPSVDIYTITGCFSIKTNESLREDMFRYGYAALMAEGLDIVSAEEDADEKLFWMLQESLEDVTEKSAPASAWLFLFRLLKYAGYRLNMFSCVSCGKKPSAKTVFSPAEGGIGCADCFFAEKEGFPVSLKTLDAVRTISPEKEIEKDVQKEIGKILAKFVKYQFNRDFKSFQFLDLFSGEKNKCTFNS